MDKITQYENTIIALLEGYATMKKSLMPDVKTELLVDTVHKHYQLLSTGWHNDRYIYQIALHLSLKEGKVWVIQNNTEVLIADELQENGVPKSDIVLAFIPPKVRAATGFAVA